MRNDYTVPLQCETASHCGLTQLFPSSGACRDLQWNADTDHFNERFYLRGFVVGETNTTVIFRSHSTFTSAHGCHACIKGPQGTCQRIDACDFDTAPLPSHMSLMPAVGADAIVFNFGLHYGKGSIKMYRAHMARLLREMASFGEKSVHSAVFRETSAQHFPVASGDYHEERNRQIVVGITLHGSAMLSLSQPLARYLSRLSRATHHFWWCGTKRGAMGSRISCASGMAGASARLTARLRLGHGATRLCTMCSSARGSRMRYPSNPSRISRLPCGTITLTLCGAMDAGAVIALISATHPASGTAASTICTMR